jgi:hypothetical protein
MAITREQIENKRKALELKAKAQKIEKDELELQRIKEGVIRRDYMRDNYFKSLGIFLSVLFIFVSSGAFYYYSYFHYQPPTNFIAVDENSRILEEIPLNLSVMEDGDLSQWATDSVKEIFSYNYLTFDKHGSEIRGLFSDRSYGEFMDVFNNLRLQKKVEVQKAIVEPVILKAIVVEKSGEFLKRKAWEMKGVLLLNLHGKNGIERIKYNVYIMVVRTSFEENRRGVVVHKIQLT